MGPLHSAPWKGTAAGSAQAEGLSHPGGLTQKAPAPWTWSEGEKTCTEDRVSVEKCLQASQSGGLAEEPERGLGHRPPQQGGCHMEQLKNTGGPQSLSATAPETKMPYQA